MMKQSIYISIVLFLFALNMQSQDKNATSNESYSFEEFKKTHIPIFDKNFEKVLIELGYDDQLNGWIKKENVGKITQLKIAKKNIKSLAGIEQFKALQYLDCSSNQIEILSLSDLPNLSYLNCAYNKLEVLALDGDSNLTSLYCNNNKLTYLNITSNIKLQILIANSNLFKMLVLKNTHNKSLEKVDIKENKNIYRIVVDNEKEAVENKGVYANWQHDEALSLSVYETKSATDDRETYVPDAYFEAYLEANSMGNGDPTDGYVLTSNIEGVTNLDVSFKNIALLTGIEDFRSLRTLQCSDNRLSSLDVSNNLNLKWLFCYKNTLTSLKVNNNSNLEWLSCYNNSISNLDVRNNSNIQKLWCSNNSLSSLDVSNCLNLGSLICESNSIRSLNVSNNQDLYELWCSDNSLSSLDVSNNLNLGTLACASNSILNLDLNNNPNLFQLFCQNNSLTTLDVSDCKDLRYFRSDNNSLTTLDARNGNNAILTSVYVINNPDLYCILVDDPESANAGGTPYNSWYIDAGVSYTDNPDDPNCGQANCEDPKEFVVTNTTTESVSLHWRGRNIIVDGWEIEYGITGFTQGSGQIITVPYANGNSYTVTGLDSDTTYDFYIRTHCYEDLYSIWVGPIQGTTLNEPCSTCNSFRPKTDVKYVLDAWVKEAHKQQQALYTHSQVKIVYLDSDKTPIGEHTFSPAGNIIEGWQRINGVFTIPTQAAFISIDLVNTHDDSVYFDDVRVFPYSGNMKSFVYDNKTKKLMAELDENNYATFYEYDNEGGLIRIKKETERGVFTIQETRSASVKTTAPTPHDN